MNENLLHTIWKYKLTHTQHFIGSKGETIQVISIGEHNQNAGPDFFNSKIEINGILLVGNVEIHTKTSDWLKHKHQLNRAYDNLVLHVVYENDVELPQNLDFNVSTLELKSYIKPNLLEQYKTLQTSKNKIACGQSISSIEPLIWNSWLDRLAITRMEEKTTYIQTIFKNLNGNFEETLYILLLKNFGFKINSVPFELLAKTVNYNLLKKYADNVIQLEALLYGAAGILDDLFEDDYPKLLQNEFEFLKHKHAIIPLKKEIWKFSKTRPVNFPTIRISQLTSLFQKQQSLYHFIETRPSIAQFKVYFNVETNTYFKSHFKFDSLSLESLKQLGDDAINNLIINTIVPFLFFLSHTKSDDSLQDYALQLLTQIKPEVNTKTKLYTSLGIKPQNALETQALIKLHDSYCTNNGCLNCNVAQVLLKQAI